MLIIKKIQMDALEQIMKERFMDRLERKILGYFPELEQTVGGKEKFTHTLADIVTRAEAYGIGDDLDLAVFSTLFCANFKLADSHPHYLSWTKTVLEREESDGSTKIGFIEHKLSKLAPNDPVAARLVTLCNEMRQNFHG